MLLASADGVIGTKTLVAGIIRSPRGTWRMALHDAGGAEVWRKPVTGALDRTPFPARGRVKFEALGPRGMFDFAVPLEDSARLVRVLVAVDEAGKPSVAFDDVSGAEPDEYGSRVELVDIRGSGERNLVVSGIGDAPTLCDGAPARVHPSIYDWKTRKLRSASITPGIDGLATLTAAPAKDPAPALARMTFVAASSTPGDGGSVRAVAPPRALGDGDDKTPWIEGEPRFGPGAFVVASTATSRPIHAVRIVPGHGATDKSWKGHNRIKEAILVVGGDAGGKRWLVKIPDAPKPTVMTVTLPAPATASCLALVVRDVHPGKDKSRTALSELSVLTDLDITVPDRRAAVLVEEVAGGGARAAASADSLSALGEPGVAAILEGHKKATDPTARARLLRTLLGFDRSHVAAAQDACLLALGAGTEDERRAASEVLASLGAAVVPVVAALMDDPVRRREALITLALIGHKEMVARAALLALLLDATDETRPAVSDALDDVGAPLWPDAVLAMSDLAAETAPDTTAAFIRLVAGGAMPPGGAGIGLPLRVTAIKRLIAWTTPDNVFSVRFYATKALARFTGTESVDALSLVVLKDPQEVIRERAVASLAEHSGERPALVITRALKDDDYRVRKAALRVVAEATADTPEARGKALDGHGLPAGLGSMAGST